MQALPPIMLPLLLLSIVAICCYQYGPRPEGAKKLGQGLFWGCLTWPLQPLKERMRVRQRGKKKQQLLLLQILLLLQMLLLNAATVAECCLLSLLGWAWLALVLAEPVARSDTKAGRQKGATTTFR